MKMERERISPKRQSVWPGLQSTPFLSLCLAASLLPFLLFSLSPSPSLSISNSLSLQMMQTHAYWHWRQQSALVTCKLCPSAHRAFSSRSLGTKWSCDLMLLTHLKWATPFRNQVIELAVFSSPPFASAEEERLNKLCPVRALRCYAERTRAFRQSDQLLCALAHVQKADLYQNRASPVG